MLPEKLETCYSPRSCRSATREAVEVLLQPETRYNRTRLQNCRRLRFAGACG